MSEVNIGDQVVCGICGRDTSVQFITDREGGKAYDLNCMHRNTTCPTCGAIAKDGSESILSVKASCRKCDPQDFEYDDDE